MSVLHPAALRAVLIERLPSPARTMLKARRRTRAIFRAPWLVTCASIAGCDDYDEIADWGVHHQMFLKGYAEYFFGTPKEDWLRVVLNRIDPALFEACFTAAAMMLRSDAPDLIALDGKTVRRSGRAPI